MTRSAHPNRPLRFLALGDSYTIGEAVPEAERWPVLLADRLRAEGIPIDPPLIIARTGWTTDELSAGIDAAKPNGPFDVVTLLIGVNDQYRGRAVEQFATDFRALLTRAVGFAAEDARRVVVISIPDWGVTPFAAGRDRARIGAEIDRFNEVVRGEAVTTNARFVDVTPVSRRAAADSALVAADGLHPSGAMYAAWCDVIRPVALAALGFF